MLFTHKGEAERTCRDECAGTHLQLHAFRLSATFVAITVSYLTKLEKQGANARHER